MASRTAQIVGGERDGAEVPVRGGIHQELMPAAPAYYVSPVLAEGAFDFKSVEYELHKWYDGRTIHYRYIRRDLVPYLVYDE